MSNGWSLWVMFLVVFNMGITLFLFLWAPRAKIPTLPDGTSGHVWAHGVLREGVRNLPRWWILMSVAMFVAGFASATRLKAAELLPNPTHAATLAAAEAAILAHCNDDHADALALLGATQGTPGPWRMVAADLDDDDLALADHVTRFAWRAPVADPAGLRTELIHLVREAREVK